MFHDNPLLADDYYEISCLFRKSGKQSQNLSSAAVVIGALRLIAKITRLQSLINAILKME